MDPQAYAAVKEEWSKISNQEQRTLLYLYVKNKNNGQTESWMEFLYNHFQLGACRRIAIFSQIKTFSGNQAQPYS